MYDFSTKFTLMHLKLFLSAGFIRPVVLFGPLTDIVKERLLRDYPECYASPRMYNFNFILIIKFIKKVLNSVYK